MKKLLTFLLVIGSLTSMAQVKGVIVEEVNNDGVVPGRTFRIYVECTSDKDYVTSIFAFNEHDMYWRSTKPFFQSAYGGPLSSNSIRATVKEKKELKYDSWFTIGFVDNYGNAVNGFNLDFEGFENGEGIESTDGAWYATPDNPQTKAGTAKKVLIAQLTSEGIISGKFNVLGRTVTNADRTEWDNWEIHGLTFTAGDK